MTTDPTQPGDTGAHIDSRGLAVIVTATLLLVFWFGWCLRCTECGLPSTQASGEILRAGSLAPAGLSLIESLLSPLL